MGDERNGVASSLWFLLKSSLCLLDCLSEIYLCGQFRGLGDYPSHLCCDRGLALLKGEDKLEFSFRDRSLRSGEWIDRLWGYDSFKRSFDGRWIGPSGSHGCIRI